jgi:hypothetical protein
MKTTRAVDLAKLAQTYAARAQSIGTAPDDSDPQEVEVRILTTIHDAVRKRAAHQNQEVAAIARAVLFKAAAQVTAAERRSYAKQRTAEIQLAGERAATRATDKARREAKRLGIADVDDYLISDVVIAQIAQARERAEDKERNARRPLRGYRQKRYRLRFTAPREPYTEAARAILDSGRTLVSAVEDGLREYAKSGTV